MLDGVEFDETGKNGCIGVHLRSRLMHILQNTAHVFRNFENAHVQPSMLLLVLNEESFEILMNRVQKCVHLF